MKIISKFKDYYDNVSSHGIDETIVYIRHQEEILAVDNKIKHPLFDSKVSAICRSVDSKFKRKQTNYYTEFGLVYLCGKLYPFIKIETDSEMKEISKGNFRYTKNEKFYYDKESLVEDFSEIVKEVEPIHSYWFQDKYGEPYRRNVDGNYILDRFFDLRKSDVDYFVQNKFVCFSMTRQYLNYKGNYILTINPELNKFQFQKVIDPYTAFQEISGFISGVIGSPAMPIIQIADKDMVVSKGFDPVYGFRKRKEV